MKKWLVLSLAVLSIIGGNVWLHAQNTTQRELPKLTSAQYAAADSETIYVMLVGYDGCGPCRLAENTVFRPLVETYANDPKVKVVKVDTVQDAKETAEADRIDTRFNITKAPTMLVVYHQDVMWRQEGFSLKEKQTLKDTIIKEVSNLK